MWVAIGQRVDNYLIDQLPRNLQRLRVVATRQGCREFLDSARVGCGHVGAGRSRRFSGGHDYRSARLDLSLLRGFKLPEPGENSRACTTVADRIHQIGNLAVGRLALPLACRGMDLEFAVQTLPFQVERLHEGAQQVRLHQLTAEYVKYVCLERGTPARAPVGAGAVLGRLAA